MTVRHSSLFPAQAGIGNKSNDDCLIFSSAIIQAGHGLTVSSVDVRV